MATDIRLQEEILRIMAGSPSSGFSSSTVRELLGHVDEKRFRRIFRSLVKSGQLLPVARHRYVLPPATPAATPPKGLLQGRLQVSSHGFGFVHPEIAEPGQADIFIPPGQLGGGISGDLVEVQVYDPDNPRGPCGEVVQVLERRFSTVVGCLQRYGQGWAIRPLRRELPELLTLLNDYDLPKQSQEGDWIKATLQTDPDGGHYAVLDKRLGASGSVGADLDAIVEEFNLPPRYTPEFEARAAKHKPVGVSREDRTDELTLTIDPMDARDFDDALSSSDGPGQDECTVAVHIADVACYVQPDNFLDLEARRRCFTSYLPGRTLPMLPAALANDLCSLQAGVPRLTHSVFLRLSKRDGQLLSFRRTHSTIKVKRRLCYEEVSRFLAGEDLAFEPEISSAIKALHRMAQLLRQRRQSLELFLPMDMPEIRVVCSENPSRIVGLQTTEHNPSHQLVEEFMLAANQCMAQELQQHRLPGLFRNHAAPEEDSLQEFAVQAGQILGKRIKPFRKRRQLVDFLYKLPDHQASRDLLQMSFLRCLPRADYGSECNGHYGLGKDHYCHFTSPIRRYADLLVHQQLLARDRRRKRHSKEQMQSFAQLCSAQEENCDQASYAASDRLKLRYLQQQQKEDPLLRLRGLIIRVSKNGLGVFLPEYSLMGFVNALQLPRHTWYYLSSTQTWKNHLNGETLSAMSEMYFSPQNNDPIRGELALTPFFLPAKNRRRRET